MFHATDGLDEVYLDARLTEMNSNPELQLTHDPDNGFEFSVAAQGRDYADQGLSTAGYHLITFQHVRDALMVWVDGNNMVGQWDAFGDQPDQVLTDALTLVLSPSGEPLAMDLAEMIVVSDDLHFGERRPYEDYLAAKWFGSAFERTATAFGEASVWLDAQAENAITTDANDGVLSWINQGRGGGNFANGTFANSRPELVSAGLHGHPVVRFDSADALGQNSVRLEEGAARGEFAIVMVMTPPSTGSRQLVFQSLRSSNSGLHWQLDVLPGVPGFEFLHRVPAGDSGGETWAPTADLSAPRIVLIERTATGRFSVRVDDTTATFNGDADADILQVNMDWVLGGESIAAPGDGLEGDIAEFMVLSNRLNAAEEEALFDVLREKWGL